MQAMTIKNDYFTDFSEKETLQTTVTKNYTLGHVPKKCPHCGSSCILSGERDFQSDYFWRCVKCGAGEIYDSKKTLPRVANNRIELVCSCGKTFYTLKSEPRTLCLECRNKALQKTIYAIIKKNNFYICKATREYVCDTCGLVINQGFKYKVNKKHTKRWHIECEPR